ncbi:hypothetical protein EJD97_017387 [Solanum chilense]|uniref:Uncharacterized protein n=1 Tax=Solanum chilense TaxID=4083 RepID=A0A6N2CDZ5_SOLCI|nr:hypothetical protein EJD97_017387 [Solanum chilense]
MRASTISAAPSLSPDITPLLSDSSLPTITSTLSPPNPDAMVAPGPFQQSVFSAILVFGLLYYPWTCFHCRNLTELDLGESEVEDLSSDWLTHFPHGCTSLVSLNIFCLGPEISLSDLESLIARSPNLNTLRLSQAVPLEKLPHILSCASQLVEFGTGAYSSDLHSHVFSNLQQAFSGCNILQGLSGFCISILIPETDPYVYHWE